jgi:hypothetical protein
VEERVSRRPAEGRSVGVGLQLSRAMATTWREDGFEGPRPPIAS